MPSEPICMTASCDRISPKTSSKGLPLTRSGNTSIRTTVQIRI
jgi:hypothetical protein